MVHSIRSSCNHGDHHRILRNNDQTCGEEITSSFSTPYKANGGRSISKEIWIMTMQEVTLLQSIKKNLTLCLRDH